MEEYYGKNLVFVAGGIGLIPLRSCIVYALNHREKYERIQIFYGSKTPNELMYLPNLREWEGSMFLSCTRSRTATNTDASRSIAVQNAERADVYG